MNEIKILLKAKNQKELLSIPYFKEILKLCQILNTIRSAQRILIQILEHSKGPTKNRDIFYGLITNSSYLYEGFKTSDKIFKKIYSIIPEDKYKDINWIHMEVKDNNSFFKRIIEKIRNNIGFHFNYQMTNEQIKKVAVDFPLTFAQCISERKIDLVYLMADQLMAELPPFSNIPENNKEKEIKNIIINLIDYSNRFCDSLDEIIAVSLKRYLELKD